MNREWYAVYTTVRHEKKVNDALSEKNVETFLPLREVLSQWRDRRKRIKVPLFPGYLFINIALEDRLRVLSTKGALRIVGSGGVPVPVSLDQIEAIKRVVEGKVEYDCYPYLTQGREVVVINGPLEGVRGRILERRGNYRLIISVDTIKRSVSVEVDPRDIELV
ncbi:MAG: antitermination protein NusG [Candidatus Dadabacteria bacterium]